MKPTHNIPFHQPTFIGEEGNWMQQAMGNQNWAKVSEQSRHFFDDYYAPGSCFFTNSCSSALEIAIGALGVGNGDEIIIPAFSYVALANAVVNNGATPIFADVELPTGNIEIASIAKCISPRTKAIIALHYAGNSCNIADLLDICSANNIYLIEDAAQCIGSTYNDKPLGIFGHIGCLSFDYMKNVSCGQGGLLIVNDQTLLNKVQTIYDNGTNRYAMMNGSQKYFEWVGKGVNCQINPLASYFLGAQLAALNIITASRLSKWNLYNNLLSSLVQAGNIMLNKPAATHNGHIFYVIARSESERNSLQSFLKQAGISSEHHYSSLANSPFGKQFVSPRSSLQNANLLCSQLLRLPLWHSITESDIEIVAASITAFYN